MAAMALGLLALGPGGGRAYPHYLLNPEGCKTKKLEVRGWADRSIDRLAG